MADKGYDVTMLDEVEGGNGYGIAEKSNPDYLINNKAFDCYSSDETTSINNVCRQITKKTQKQAERIVLNLDDFPENNLTELKGRIISKTNENGDLKHLKELIVVRDGTVKTWYVR